MSLAVPAVAQFEGRLDLPLTLSQITQANSTRRGRFLRFGQSSAGRALFLIGFFLLSATVAKTLWPSAFTELSRLPGWIFAALGGALIGFCPLMAFFDSFPAFTPMSSALCGDMNRWLSALPDGEAFRQAVVAQGRLFTDAEARAAENLHKEFQSWREKQMALNLKLHGSNADMRELYRRH